MPATQPARIPSSISAKLHVRPTCAAAASKDSLIKRHYRNPLLFFPAPRFVVCPRSSVSARRSRTGHIPGFGAKTPRSLIPILPLPLSPPSAPSSVNGQNGTAKLAVRPDEIVNFTRAAAFSLSLTDQPARSFVSTRQSQTRLVASDVNPG